VQADRPLEKQRAGFGIAAQLMRRILVDHARSRGTAKRGAGLRVTLDSDLLRLSKRLKHLAFFGNHQSRLG
jgi:hypothetical protein